MKFLCRTSVLPGTTNPDLTCFILKNSSLHPIAQALTIPSASQTTTTTTTSTTTSTGTPTTTINKTSPPLRSQTPNSSSAILPTPVAAINEATNSLHAIPVELLKSVRKKDHNRSDLTTPLDLSVRRLSTELMQRERSVSFSSSISGDHGRLNIDAMMEGKENLSIDSNSVTPEQIVCAPSLPGSPPLTPSPKHASHSPRGILATSPNSLLASQHHHHHHHQLRPITSSDLAARLADPSNIAQTQHIIDRQSVELAMRLSASTATQPDGLSNSLLPAQQPTKTNILNATKKGVGSSSHGPPQIFVKQGVSKCKECNIVFCKYENYLAHKKHYCSARNLEDKDGGKPSPPPSPLPTGVGAGGTTGSGTAPPPHTYQQLICAACGIKFTSIDNLNAHQMYYCPKRIEVPIQVRRFLSLLYKQNIFIILFDFIQAPIQKDKCNKCKTIHDGNQQCSNNQNVYKCPICDVVNTSAAESRRHIETHAGVKAFRCSICRYKGNTLRLVFYCSIKFLI